MANLQVELDQEGTEKLIAVMRSARAYTSLSYSHPRSDELRRELADAVFHFNNWEAGAMLVPIRDER